MSAETPELVYQKIFSQFETFAKNMLDEYGETGILMLVVPWVHGANYPPGSVVTRNGQLVIGDVVACARQLHVMTERVYESYLAAISANAAKQKSPQLTAAPAVAPAASTHTQ